MGKKPSTSNSEARTPIRKSTSTRTGQPQNPTQTDQERMEELRRQIDEQRRELNGLIGDLKRAKQSATMAKEELETIIKAIPQIVDVLVIPYINMKLGQFGESINDEHDKGMQKLRDFIATRQTEAYDRFSDEIIELRETIRLTTTKGMTDQEVLQAVVELLGLNVKVQNAGRFVTDIRTQPNLIRRATKEKGR